MNVLRLYYLFIHIFVKYNEENGMKSYLQRILFLGV